LVLEHLRHGVSERKHDSQRQTLGHGDDNNGDTGDDVTQPLRNEFLDLTGAVFKQELLQLLVTGETTSIG
jgi:hypothetical protein